jgi:hypothetical protein
MSDKPRSDFDKRLVKLAIQIEADSLMRELAEESTTTISKKRIPNIENLENKGSHHVLTCNSLSYTMCPVDTATAGSWASVGLVN